MGKQDDVKQAIESFTAQYNTAKGVYLTLPDLKDLDFEFEILEMVGRECHFPQDAVKYTRWYIMRAITSWLGFLHEFILPNQHSAVSMEEYDYFDEKEKKGIIAFMNWVMYRQRCVNLVQLEENDKESAELIAQILTEWKEKKPFLKTLMKKNVDVWQKKAGA
jgi:hypothetical protein